MSRLNTDFPLREIPMSCEEAMIIARHEQKNNGWRTTSDILTMSREGWGITSTGKIYANGAVLDNEIHSGMARFVQERAATGSDLHRRALVEAAKRRLTR